MQTQSHTPGPWKLEEQEGVYTRHSGYYFIEGVIDEQGINGKENAELIAQAPALHEKVKELEAHVMSDMNVIADLSEKCRELEEEKQRWWDKGAPFTATLNDQHDRIDQQAKEIGELKELIRVIEPLFRDKKSMYAALYKRIEQALNAK